MIIVLLSIMTVVYVAWPLLETAPAKAPARTGKPAKKVKSAGSQAVVEKFCSQCGAKLATGAKFCSQCGNKLN